MSSLATAVPARADTPTIGATLRRGRFVLVAAAIIVAIAATTLLLSGSLASTATFAADNPGPHGARALASVLGEHGVQVTTTDSPAKAAAAASGAALLVDDSDDLLDAAQWRRLLRSTDRLVVVSPGYAALSTVLPAAHFAGSPGLRTASAGCTDPLARRAGTMSLTGAASSLRAVGAAGGTAVCFGRSGTGQLVTGRTGAVAVTLLASTAPFENQHIASAGNAAVALGALGARDRLVWLRPGVLASASGSAPTLQGLTPQWVTPLMAMLIAAAVAAAFWQGRRLGPLVVERLPVVVRSRETIEGRARLYARGGARLRAADALRIGTIGRLAPLLGLSRLSGVEEIAVAAAARTGRGIDQVRAILVAAQPRSDAALVRLSDDLARLERAVRGATAVPGHDPHPNGAP